MQQQSMFDEAPPAGASVASGESSRDLPSTSDAPPAKWLERAVSACFAGQKKRWQALTDEQRERIGLAMWGYSLAREKARAAPLTAYESEAALLGWIDKCESTPHLRVLQEHLVVTSDIPMSGAHLVQSIVASDEGSDNDQAEAEGPQP